VALARLGAPAKPALLDAGEEHRQSYARRREHDRHELRIVCEHDSSLARAVVASIGN
jgi:hypothetical protein